MKKLRQILGIGILGMTSLTLSCDNMMNKPMENKPIEITEPAETEPTEPTTDEVDKITIPALNPTLECQNKYFGIYSSHQNGLVGEYHNAIEDLQNRHNHDYESEDFKAGVKYLQNKILEVKDKNLFYMLNADTVEFCDGGVFPYSVDKYRDKHADLMDESFEDLDETLSDYNAGSLNFNDYLEASDEVKDDYIERGYGLQNEFFQFVD